MDLKLLVLFSIFFAISCGSDSEEACDDVEFSCEVFQLVNDERANADLPALKYDAALATSAQRHAADMKTQNYFSHTSLDGRNFSQRTLDAGYDAFPSGENIAAGQMTPAAVMQSWMNSPGHRANILSANFNEIGVGYESAYWVQVFGSR